MDFTFQTKELLTLSNWNQSKLTISIGEKKFVVKAIKLLDSISTM